MRKKKRRAKHDVEKAVFTIPLTNYAVYDEVSLALAFADAE